MKNALSIIIIFVIIVIVAILIGNALVDITTEYNNNIQNAISLLQIESLTVALSIFYFYLEKEKLIMKKWTLASAISYLNGNGAEVENNLIIVSKTGLSGLKACSALDFLTNHFIIIMKNRAQALSFFNFWKGADI